MSIEFDGLFYFYVEIHNLFHFQDDLNILPIVG